MNRLLLASALWFVCFMSMTALSPTEDVSCCPWCPRIVEYGDAGCYWCCPIVACPANQRANLGQVVVLQGSVIMDSEEEQVCISEKNTLQYQWEQLDGPRVELKDANQVQASFIATETGSYLFRFRAIYPSTDVNKDERSSDWCYTKVTVGGAYICGPPFSDAGYDQVLSTSPGSPQTVYLDGTKSHVVHQEGCGLFLISHTWTVISEPAGSSVSITDSDRAEASAVLSVVGEYQFQLEVKDDGGTDGRTDTATETVKVTLVEREGCGADLEVTAINAATGETLADVLITVVDTAENSHTATTNAGGVAVFDSLADGERQSITAVCDELVPPVGGPLGAYRPRFETTTVMNHCASRITIPMRYTASGKRAGEWGTVVAKVPTSVFDMLPHSWICAGDCTDDDDCDETYYCELDEDTPCGPHPPEVPRGACTPRSVLPFFSLGNPYVSGQVRFVMVLPVFPLGGVDRFPVGTLFARPGTDGALWPGNLATDDTFLNGLATALGLDLGGDQCTTTSDCPDENVCEQYPSGDYLCKDWSALKNIRIEIPAGRAVRLIAVAGIIDFSMLDILPWLLPVLTSDSVNIDYSFLKSFLAHARMNSLLVCPFTADVAASGETEVSSELAALSDSDCWRVEYQSKDTVVPLKSPYDPDPDDCRSDVDCCNDGGNCGWPGSGRKCLYDPDEPNRRKCFFPLFRVEIISGDYVTLLPPTSGFDPYAVKSDKRLCSWVPDSSPFEVLCPTSTPNFYVSCDPLDIRDLDVSPEHECSFPYGLSIASLDFPPGHTAIPEGGRVIVGFGLNHTPSSFEQSPKFLVPSLHENDLEGAAISAAQLIHRNTYHTPDGSCKSPPGLVSATSSARSNASEIQMEDFLPFLETSGIVDPGMIVNVTFVTEDPTVFPPTLIRTYAEATQMRQPVIGTHETPVEIELAPDAGHHLLGLVIEKVDRVQDEPVVDPLWRIYIPADTTSVTLPDSASPFQTGDEVRVTSWATSFPVPFDYDLFLTDLIIHHQAAYSEDSYPGFYRQLISFP